jgi:hypothetical protein
VSVHTTSAWSSLQHNLNITTKDMPVCLDSWALARSFDRELSAIWTVLKLVASDSPACRCTLRKVVKVLASVKTCLGRAVRCILLAVIMNQGTMYILRLVGSQSEKVCANAEGSAASASAATLLEYFMMYVRA